MIRNHLAWVVLAVLCFAVGCRQPSAASAAPAPQSRQQLLDQAIVPEDQMTPALLESDQANLLFAKQEMAFAQRNNIVRRENASSGPLTVAQAQEHLTAATLLQKVDQDRDRTQEDITDLRIYVVPRTRPVQ